MDGPTERLTRAQPYMLSILRIMAGLCFMQHGVRKLLSFPAARPGPEFLSLLWFAGVIELVGGALLVIGLLTRPVAFIVAGECAVAYFMSHYPRSFYPIANGGTLLVMYCFTFLWLFFAGGGAWSLDRLFRGTGAGMASRDLARG